MSEIKHSVDSLLGRLRQERDELKLKMHLASMEANQEYERISGRVDELADQYEPVKDALEETGENVFAALKLAAEELKVGYDRVKKSLMD